MASSALIWLITAVRALTAERRVVSRARGAVVFAHGFASMALGSVVRYCALCARFTR
ncbi:hypothetical protein OHB12_18760 [Nocardia sp. NBC_01730]|uniref:hypothetical protein n=1 Tax=Nocardia sp. NBC_01730 TaxID=2975998 RepID=UPI002E129D87|nr:hypothetical protein OHB12_18760 [Nocardia sp. NBC_01730]